MEQSVSLQPGLKVKLEELDNGYALVVLAADQSGCTLLEAAADYLVVEDAVAEVLHRIPRYLIRQIHDAAAPAVTEAEAA